MEELIEKVYDHLGKASVGNTLKLRNNFKFKEGEEGISPEDFCDKFIDYCVSKVREGDDPYKLGKAIVTTMNFKTDLKQKSIRKDSRMDIYLLDLRNIFR